MTEKHVRPNLSDVERRIGRDVLRNARYIKSQGIWRTIYQLKIFEGPSEEDLVDQAIVWLNNGGKD
jgi:hypothetical protein